MSLVRANDTVVGFGFDAGEPSKVTPSRTYVQLCSRDEVFVTMYNTGINDEHRPLMTFDSQEETWKIQKPLGMGLLALVLGAILLVGLMGFSAGVHMEKTFSKSASGRLSLLLMCSHPLTPLLQTGPSDSRKFVVCTDDPDAQITQQTEFSKDPRIQWLLHNHLPSGLPLAYQVDPPDYFETLPTELRPKGHTEHKDKVGVVWCHNQVPCELTTSAKGC